jgi:WD40 repeat protein
VPGASLAQSTGQPPTQPQLRIEAGMHTAMINRIRTDAVGRYAVTASDDKTARVWEVASGRLLQVLRPPIGAGDEGKLYATALSPDGRWVAAGGWTGSEWDKKYAVYLFDRATGQLTQRLTGSPNVLYHLAFSPDGRWLAAVGGPAVGLRVWPLDGAGHAAGPALVDASCQKSGYSVGWATGLRLASSCYDGQVRLFQVAPNGPNLTTLQSTQAPGGKEPDGLAFSPDGQMLAVGYDTKRVDVLRAQDLTLAFSPDTRGGNNDGLSSVAWSADGRRLMAAGMWSKDGRHPVRIWPDAGRGAAVDVPVAKSTIMGLVPLPDGRVLVATGEPAWGILSPHLPPDQAWQAMGQPPVADLRGSRDPNAYALSSNGQVVQFGFEQHVKVPHRFDVRRRSLLPGTDPALHLPLLQGLSIQAWMDTTHPALGGRPLALAEYETSRSVALAPGASSFVLGTEYRLRHYQADGQLLWQQRVPGNVWGVNIPPEGKVVVAAYGDGTIRWHRLSDGHELLAFFPHADRKRWVLWTPSGYYDASPGAEELIGWHVNRGADQAADFFPASRFRATYYRPDVIDRMLDTLDEAKALEQANAAANRRVEAPVQVAQVLPPVVDMLSPAELSTANPQVTIKVRGRTAANAPVTSWRVRVNGQASSARGLSRQEGASAPADLSEQELRVGIPAQNSTIEVFAENRHGVSVPAVFRVSWTGAAPSAPAPGSFQIQPKLYVLAVGVARYQNAGITKLGLPAKDARDFAKALQAQQGRLYREVVVKLLTDDQATRDDIVDGLDWLQKQVTQHDVGMVFIAGHGVNDPQLGYTYLPVNADPERLRRTGVAMDEFRKTLAVLPGKALFFFDTCHSGNVLGGTTRGGSSSDVSGVINELSSAENGVVVFSSSTGRQLSYEDTAWGNGAFTLALIEGLGGKADYQKNGRITHKMLDLYVSERVKQLTGGKQSPVTQAPGGVPDFPLAVVK